MSRPERSRLTLRVLVVDDNPDDRALVRRTLAKEYSGVVLHEVVDAESLERALAAGEFDLAITDFQLHWSDGLAVLRTLKARYPDRPVVMFTGTGSEEIAVEAMKSGLDDYVLKSVRHLVRLSASVRTVLARVRDRRIARETEETLHSLRKAVDTLPIGVTISDTRGLIVYTNPAEARLHGYSLEELLGKEARILVPSEFWKPLVPEQIRDLKPWKRERVNVRKDGTTFPAQLISDVVRTLSGEPIGVVTTCEDITERKWAEEQLRRNAFYDTLTGLPNRALFMDRLGWALQRARRRPEYVFAVLFLDLDRFKLVNDSFGHGVGDKLLIEAARRLAASLRPSDTIARLGGDEFAILAEEIDSAAEAIQIAERTQKELAQAFHLGPFEVFASASIGIAIAARPYAEAEELLRDADTAMYRAKAKGKARYEIFDEEMLATARGLLQLETELRRGLERGEFEVYYQPIVSLATGRTVAAEALVRWHHPQRGLLLPDAFIPVAEETGLISPLGEWVLLRACAQTRAWQEAGLHRLRVSVNLSARQFRQDNLTAVIHHALESTLFAPESLALELTESVLMDGHGNSVRGVEELKALGVRISIDDFGTGYSSLSYLKRFPVDALKIDQSFVQNVTTDPRDAAIASSVIALARNLELGVIAEGVETEDQLDFLRRAGCEEIQGYVFSRPLPPAAFERVVRTTTAGKR